MSTHPERVPRDKVNDYTEAEAYSLAHRYFVPSYAVKVENAVSPDGTAIARVRTAASLADARRRSNCRSGRALTEGERRGSPSPC